MTIPEAAQLVLQAFSIGRGGEVFVLDMGEPVKIADLAMNLILLSGLQPEHDIEIQFTGLRPGEKMFEELNLQDEHLMPTSHPKIRSYICDHNLDAMRISSVAAQSASPTVERQDVRPSCADAQGTDSGLQSGFRTSEDRLVFQAKSCRSHSDVQTNASNPGELGSSQISLPNVAATCLDAMRMARSQRDIFEPFYAKYFDYLSAFKYLASL